MQVETNDSPIYSFHPVQTFRRTIAIKAPHDAHICFTSAATETSPMVEIIIGGWTNTRSVIRYNRQQPEKAEEDTPNILSGEEHREFVFEWNANGTMFKVYGGSDSTPFLSWHNPHGTFQVTHYGVRTCWGAQFGDWICDGINYMGTGDSMEWIFNPIEAYGGYMEFDVRAETDAHVCLTSGPSEDGSIQEIILGGWLNTKSAIFDNRDDEVASFEAKVLSKDDDRKLKISWSHCNISVGNLTAPQSFLDWNGRKPTPINYFGIRTQGCNGRWRIPAPARDCYDVETGEATSGGNLGPGYGECGFTLPVEPTHPSLYPSVPTGGAMPAPVHTGPGDIGWVPVPTIDDDSRHRRSVESNGFSWVVSEGGRLPPDAVLGGNDHGEPIYVARAHHEGDIIPGKLVPSHRVCYVPWGGQEHALKNYEVLVASPSDVEWVAGRNDRIPNVAIPGGETSGGEKLYIGRTHHDGTLTTGKIHPSHGTLYIAYGGVEIGFPTYEVLIRK